MTTPPPATTTQEARRPEPLFLDTSIQIARIIREPQLKTQIERTLRGYNLKITSVVVKQEFKRRLLRDAKYLLTLFDKYNTFEEVMRHVDRLPLKQLRKMRTCMQLLMSIQERIPARQRHARGKVYLDALVRTGLAEFEASVDHVLKESKCACGLLEIGRDRRGAYEFGPDRCSKADGPCGIQEFLEARRDQLTRLAGCLREVSPKSAELVSAENFITAFLASSATTRANDPCSTVGDLLIALESAIIPTLYTLNARESRHLCRALGQNLLLRPNNPEREDRLYRNSDDNWSFDER